MARIRNSSRCTDTSRTNAPISSCPGLRSLRTSRRIHSGQDSRGPDKPRQSRPSRWPAGTFGDRPRSSVNLSTGRSFPAFSCLCSSTSTATGRRCCRNRSGAASAPSGMETRTLADEPLEEQRTGWSIWLSPRPARVQYGMALTRALLRHMRDLATLRGGRFVVLRTPSPAEARMETPVALDTRTLVRRRSGEARRGDRRGDRRVRSGHAVAGRRSD